VHNPGRPADLAVSLSVHDEREAHAACDAGADLVFVSPVFPTRSHPGATVLGAERAARLATISGCPAIALGGMTFGKYWELGPAFHGWAGIDAWLES
jgi:thiamine-phosphate pyrophosphorylase